MFWQILLDTLLMSSPEHVSSSNLISERSLDFTVAGSFTAEWKLKNQCETRINLSKTITQLGKTITLLGKNHYPAG